jgi:menaquinone-dependent protoporphyrinogen oxidase
MLKILVTYASKHGSTQQVAETIAAAIEPSGLEVEARPVRSVADAGAYDAIVLGAPLYMGRWHRDANRFVRRHRKALERLPVAVFALGPVDEKSESWEGAQKQLDRALAALPAIEPVEVRLFGGAIEPERLRFPFSNMSAADVRDWVAIRAWGRGLPERFGLEAYSSSSKPWVIA